MERSLEATNDELRTTNDSLSALEEQRRMFRSRRRDRRARRSREDGEDLTAKTRNMSQQPLLAGEVRLSLGDDLVGRTRIATVVGAMTSRSRLAATNP
jgi:hypothetical protein